MQPHEKEAQRSAKLRALAKLNEDMLRDIYGVKMGFFLVVSPINRDMIKQPSAIADYIGNCRREDGIEWMKETIERFEKREDIPETRGNA